MATSVEIHAHSLQPYYLIWVVVFDFHNNVIRFGYVSYFLFTEVFSLKIRFLNTPYSGF